MDLLPWICSLLALLRASITTYYTYKYITLYSHILLLYSLFVCRQFFTDFWNCQKDIKALWVGRRDQNRADRGHSGHDSTRRFLKRPRRSAGPTRSCQLWVLNQTSPQGWPHVFNVSFHTRLPPSSRHSAPVKSPPSLWGHKSKAGLFSPPHGRSRTQRRLIVLTQLLWKM